MSHQIISINIEGQSVKFPITIDCSNCINTDRPGYTKINSESWGRCLSCGGDKKQLSPTALSILQIAKTIQDENDRQALSRTQALNALNDNKKHI